MKVVQTFLGAMALATVSVNPANIAAQGLPQLRTQVEALEHKVEMLEDALSGVTDSVADLDSRTDSSESTATALIRRISALEERIDALEGALVGLTCPEGQFVRGFNTSGGLLCAAPGPQENPDETIFLSDLAADLRAELNELLVTSATFLAEDASVDTGVGSLSLTNITLQLTCSDECVPTLEAKTPGDGSTLVANYELDGTIEVTGDAEINSSFVNGSITAPFVVIYQNIGVTLVSEIDQIDGSVVSVTSSSSPDTTEAEILDDSEFGDLGAFADLFLNQSESQINSSLNAFFDHVHETTLGNLEPIDLPGDGM